MPGLFCYSILVILRTSPCFIRFPENNKVLMIHFIQDAPSELVAVSVDGKLTKKDYEKFNQMVRLKDHTEDLRLYIEINNWEGITLKAIFEDIRTSLEGYNGISKMAVAGDVRWLKNWTKAGDLISPGVEVKSFNIAQKAEAMSWLDN